MARARPAARAAAKPPASKGKAKRDEDDLLSDSDAEPDAFVAGKDRVAIDEEGGSGDDSDGLNEQGVYDLSSDVDEDDDDDEDDEDDDDDLDEDIERGGEIGQRAFVFCGFCCTSWLFRWLQNQNHDADKIYHLQL